MAATGSGRGSCHGRRRRRHHHRQTGPKAVACGHFRRRGQSRAPSRRNPSRRLPRETRWPHVCAWPAPRGCRGHPVRSPRVGAWSMPPAAAACGHHPTGATRVRSRCLTRRHRCHRHHYRHCRHRRRLSQLLCRCRSYRSRHRRRLRRCCPRPRRSCPCASPPLPSPPPPPWLLEAAVGGGRRAQTWRALPGRGPRGQHLRGTGTPPQTRWPAPAG